MKKVSIFLVLIIAFAALAQATIYMENTSLDTLYMKGENISGWANISFYKHSVDEKVKDTEENEFSLKEFLDLANYTYNCSIKDCLSDYTASNSSSIKTFFLKENETRVLGFKFGSNLEGINSVSFNLASTAGLSEKNQIKIDILKDGKIDTGNSKISSQLSATTNYGCYNITGESIGETTLESSKPFCQKIELDEAPGFQVGAWLKKTENNDDNGVTIEMFTKKGTLIKDCDFTSGQISPSGSEVFCTIDVLVPEKDYYYFCLSRDIGNNEFYTKAYISQKEDKKCGFQGNIATGIEEVAAYQIGARAKKFNPVGKINILDELPTGDIISGLFQSYIQEKYGSLDCSSGCYVPVQLMSSVNQTVTISNIATSYNPKNAGQFSSNLIFDLQEDSSDINSEFQVLSFDNILPVGPKLITRTYELTIGGEEIVKDKITVKNIIFSLSPTKIVSNYPEEFVISMSSNETISKYEWDFGDNKTGSSTTLNKTTHSFDLEGNYTIKVKLIDAQEKAISRFFLIEVLSPKNLIDSEIKSMQARLTTMETKIAAMSPFEKSIVESKISLSELNAQVEFLDLKFKAAKSNADYEDIISEILSMEVPEGIVKSVTPRTSLISTPEKVFPESVKQSSFDNITSSDSEIETAVVYWNTKNMATKVSTKTVSIDYGDFKEDLFNSVLLQFSPKIAVDEYYVYFDDYSLTPSINDSVTKTDEYSYIVVPKTRAVEFISEGNIYVDDLPLFIAPPISALSLVGEIPEVVDKNNTVKIILIIVLSLIVFAIIYFFLRKWYQYNYETHLFKDRNNLYNVMIYVSNSKKQGLTGDKIKASLEKSGWTSEQIRYIMLKFENKETGLPALLPTKDKTKNTQPTQPQSKQIRQNRGQKHTNFNK
ncbi:MAG: PKD domain-containing protein [Nanoarchaeota archaeon]|jgi:hypothetical protein|nr:PKD domain-containing protein [Nanoarchaeota archaeon]